MKDADQIAREIANEWLAGPITRSSLLEDAIATALRAAHRAGYEAGDEVWTRHLIKYGMDEEAANKFKREVQAIRAMEPQP